MSTYAIGDVQGCFDELQALLDKINFNTRKDTLWFAGDLVSRGPRSLDTLRFVRNLPEDTVCVLGNHDLHLLALAYTNTAAKKRSDLVPILKAEDCDDLLHWLRHRPLMHHDNSSGISLVHAGLPPQWGIQHALQHASEVEHELRSPDYSLMLTAMYGDQPDLWSDNLRGEARLRFIINCFTRLRYCDADGRFCFNDKGPPGSQSEGLYPWFQAPHRRSRKHPVIFGHWSSLGQAVWPQEQVYGLDTGCVWGGSLTAMRLEDRRLFSVPGKGYRKIK